LDNQTFLQNVYRETSWNKAVSKSGIDTKAIKRQRNPITGPEGSRSLRLSDFKTFGK
jgi:hypothetical protein